MLPSSTLSEDTDPAVAQHAYPTRRRGRATPSESLDNLARYFHILTFLRERQGTRVRREDIAQATGGGSVRNLQRYLTTLKTSGLIDYNKSSQSYWLHDEGVHFPGPLLSAEDRLAVGIAHALLGGEGIPEGERIRAALRRAGGTADAKNQSLFAGLAGAVQPLAPARDYANAPLALLSEAARTRQTIEMDYESRSGGERSWRAIDPYALEMRDGRLWEMQAWCHRNTAFRTFALDAVHAARLTGTTFARREAEWEEFQGQPGVFGGLRGGAAVAVEVHFDPLVAGYVRRRRWPAGLTVTTHTDGSASLIGQAQGTDGIVSHLLSWRRHAVVAGGAQLQQAMKAEIAAMLARYGPPPDRENTREK